MKNLDKIYNNVKCYDCNLNGFFCYTPFGADYHTCPLCGAFDYMGDVATNDIYDKWCEIDLEGYYCHKCNILFQTGCTHKSKGCTDDVYNAHLIGKYKYKDIEYIGMPQFDSVDEFIEEIITNNMKNIEILEWICVNNGWHCKGDKHGYPKSKYPTHYDQCYLIKKT